ncbi:MAG: hypothetical protein IPG80_19420 [Anaerolineales bacterium]|uniref:hypothetical protein n=1 Tax=Candidatus Villigracilis vicinus TaxID=3140679 RepID=UPI0031350332|nr:hypothetical protein [Anaerolineales bacterium]
MQKRNKTIDLAIASAFKASKHNWFCSEASKVAKIKSGLTKRAATVLKVKSKTLL